MKFIYLILAIVLVSCNSSNLRGEFVGTESKIINGLVVLDSNWEYFHTREYIDTLNSFIHKYELDSNSLPTKYSLELKKKTVFQMDSLQNEKKWISGSNVQFLSNRKDHDSIVVEVLVAKPYTLKGCLQVDVVTTNENGIRDTIVQNYNPKGDVTRLQLSSKELKRMDFYATICGNKTGHDYIKL
jgi:hypothetical protein